MSVFLLMFLVHSKVVTIQQNVTVECIHYYRRSFRFSSLCTPHIVFMNKQNIWFHPLNTQRSFQDKSTTISIKFQLDAEQFTLKSKRAHGAQRGISTYCGKQCSLVRQENVAFVLYA